jgi:hypothetical protein
LALYIFFGKKILYVFKLNEDIEMKKQTVQTTKNNIIIVRCILQLIKFPTITSFLLISNIKRESENIILSKP